MPSKAKVFRYAQVFQGKVQESDFDLTEEELPPLSDGEFMAEAMFISPDPYQRTLILSFRVGVTMVGRQIAR
jgi:prostaglandin reductase 1